jgi:Uma2 family endonuclease
MMSPAGFGHGEIAVRFGRFLDVFAEESGLGVALAAETGYLIERNPDLVRAPDASFVRKDRVPKTRWKKYFPGVPDLAVEVVSPGDTRREIAEKVNMWLAHGTVSCWVADPDSMTLTIHRTGQKPRRLTVGDTITDEPALPGFSLPLARIFKRP